MLSVLPTSDFFLYSHFSIGNKFSLQEAKLCKMSLKLRSLPDPTGLLRDDSWGKEDGCHWEYKLRDSQGYLAQIGFCCFFFFF